MKDPPLSLITVGKQVSRKDYLWDSVSAGTPSKRLWLLEADSKGQCPWCPHSVRLSLPWAFTFWTQTSTSPTAGKAQQPLLGYAAQPMMVI